MRIRAAGAEGTMAPQIWADQLTHGPKDYSLWLTLSQPGVNYAHPYPLPLFRIFRPSYGPANAHFIASTTAPPLIFFRNRTLQSIHVPYESMGPI